MNINIFWIDYSKKDIWKEWLSKIPHDRRDIYYTADYARLYGECHDGVNCYIYAKGECVYFYPFIKRPVPGISGYFDISTPYGYGGPISNTEDPVFLKEAYDCFFEAALKRNVVAEVIKMHPLLRNHLLLTDIFRGTIKKMRSTVYADIDIGEEYRWKNVYTHANRKNINKARRNNIEVKIGQDGKAWDAFKYLYAETMRVNKVDKAHFFSDEYFTRIQTHLADRYILVSCETKGRAMAVMLVLLGSSYAHCHLIGTDRRFLNTGVNNLLHHELILWCKNNGYKKLHIGGGRTDSDEDLLLKFKKSFSDKVSDFYVGECVLNQEMYDELCAGWSAANPDKQIGNRILKYRFP